ncbi:MAG: hypothetical protein ACYC3I_03835 [Gemmataceae bacterium]
MSVLPVGQSLSRFVPDLDELVENPRAYLTQEPLTIGPRRMYGLALLFGFAGSAFLLSCLLIAPGARGELLGERLALGLGLLMGGCVWLGWSLRMRGHSLLLHPEGVEVKCRDTIVWCPWALFNVDGHAFVAGGDSPRVGLTLPVAAAAVPFVELRRDDTPIAHGVEVRAPQWYFLGADSAVLPARYEVMAGELGELLLLLGRRLGRELPKGVPPPQAYALDVMHDLPAAPDAGGWISVHLTRLAFPPRCCDCGGSTQRTMSFRIAGRGDALLSILVPASEPLEMEIPVCEACQQRIRQRQHQGGIRGMRMGGFLFCLLALLLAWSKGIQDRSLLLVIGLAALSVGALGGFLLGTLARRRLPAELRGYSPSRGTVSLRFRHPEYAASVLAAMRAQLTVSRDPKGSA